MNLRRTSFLLAALNVVACGAPAQSTGSAEQAPAAAPADAAQTVEASAAAGAGEQTQADGLPLSVRLSSAGLELDGTAQADVAALSAAVRERLALEPEARVVLSASEDVAYGRVVELVDALKAAGVRRVELALVQAATPSKPAAPAPEPGAPAPTAAAPASPEPVEDVGTLPELEVTNVGLHVGGGKNTDAEKQPFKDAVARQFRAFRLCYKHVADPAKGGTFGVDLKIGKAGGEPEVQQTRTAIKGEGFSECMVAAFRAVRFEPPERGAVVISYSLRFSTK